MSTPAPAPGTPAPGTQDTGTPDFKVEFIGGNVFFVKPLTEPCLVWLKANSCPETSAWWCGALAVHPSQIDNVTNALIEHEFSPA